MKNKIIFPTLFASTFFLRAAFAAPVAMTVIAPQDYQVAQRNASNIASVPISFTSLGQGSYLHIQAFNASGVAIADQLVAVPKSAGQQTTAVSLPAGGWYSMQLQEVDANKVTVYTQGNIGHVGVGEVFLTAGQSNSVASGQVAQPNVSLVSAASLDPTQTVLSWRNTVDNTAYGTPWPNMANPIAQRLGVPVAIVELGCGGTDTFQWLPAIATGAKAAAACGTDAVNPGGLFNRLIHASQILGSYRALLWHQGETDVIESTSEGVYHLNMQAIINSFNAGLPAHFPWFVANVSYVPGNDIFTGNCGLTMKPDQYAAEMLEVRAAQQMLVNTDHIANMGPDTDGLRGAPYRYAGTMGLCIHMSDTGLKLHGAYWYRTMVESGIVPGLTGSEPTTVPLYRFRSFWGDYFFSTSSTLSVPGFSLEGPGYFIETLPNASTVPLYQCTFTNGGHFISNASNCEGQGVVGQLGYGTTDPTAYGSRPLFRIWSPKYPWSFISTKSMDEALIAEMGNYVWLMMTNFAY